MIYLFSLVAFFNSTTNGYDGSLINNLLQNPWFIDKYNGSNSGIWAGIVSSMYQIGNIVAIPFLGPVCDSFGRRAGMASGAALIIVGMSAVTFPLKGIADGSRHNHSRY